VEIGQILEERGTRYGEFEDQSFLSQSLKDIMRHGGWDRLGDDQKEALEMMAVKMARILNGNPDHIDSWHDIAGYALLVVDRLERCQNGSPDVNDQNQTENGN
jgi:hypothetical protein